MTIKRHRTITILGKRFDKATEPDYHSYREGANEVFYNGQFEVEGKQLHGGDLYIRAASPDQLYVTRTGADEDRIGIYGFSGEEINRAKITSREFPGIEISYKWEPTQEHGRRK